MKVKFMRKITLVQLSFLIVVICVQSLLEGQTLVPAEHPDDWMLTFIDVETTGLIPGYHEMIDIGLVITDLDGNEVARKFIRLMPDHPDRLSPGAEKVNGFSVDRWKKLGAISSSTAVDSIIAFHRRIAGKKHVLMVAYNCSFDAAFLDHLFRRAGKTWRDLYFYYILDIPSMAWGKGIRLLHGEKLAHYLGIPDEPRIATEHTGITGADLNVRIYRQLLKISNPE